jgi:hypothetical protein
MKQNLIGSFTVTGAVVRRNCYSAEIFVGNWPTATVGENDLPFIVRVFAPHGITFLVPGFRDSNRLSLFALFCDR